MPPTGRIRMSFALSVCTAAGAIALLGVAPRHTAHASLMRESTRKGLDRGFGDELDRVVAELERATVQQPDGRHLVMLRALRELRDPHLRPLFNHLAGNGNPVIQINGILGLAELSDPPQVDPFLISRLGDERARYLAIRHSIESELLSAEQMQSMIAWNDLQDAPRVLLMAELMKRGITPDVDVLEKLAAHDDLSISGLAAAMLMQLERPQAFEAYRSRLAALSDTRRLQVRMWACEDLARYNLTRLVGWIESILTEESIDASLALAGTGAALYLDPQRGLAVWERMLGPEPTLTARVRYGRLLLEFADRHPIPPRYFERVRSDDSLPRQIAELGIALHSRVNRLAAMMELIDLDHWPTASRTLELASLLPEPERVRLYEHVITRCDLEGPRRDERIELAIRAVAQLIRLDPDAVRRQLAGAADDGLRQEAILLGLLGVETPAAGDAVRDVPRRGLSRADALTLLLLARHQSTLSAEDIAALRLIGEGGGRLSPGHQAQAAWLYARHLKRSEQAVARVLADS